MGNPKQKWTTEEEEALKAGVAKHGTGKWKNIQRDPEFNPHLFSRSNIDLKDKWRNMSVSAGSQTIRDKARPPKPKSNSDSAIALAPLAVCKAEASGSAAGAVPAQVKALVPIDDFSETVSDSKNVPKYNSMIFEAISALNDPNGADTSAIIAYIEQRQELPQNFRRQLSSRLRRLVAQEKLEKVQNCYKIKKDPSHGIKTPTMKQKDVRPKPLQSPSLVNSGDTVEDAALDAAYRVAEAENKSFVAAEAVKESERVSKLAEDTNSMLQLINEIFEKCSRGEVMIMG